jgi:predicted RNA-binding protein with PIN domain
MSADFALRPIGTRPIERDYGSATSGTNKAAPARGLSGTKENGCQSCAHPAGNAEGDKSEAQEASGGVRKGRLKFSQTRPVLRAEYLIVDGHSVIFAWPELRRLHARRTSLARDALTKKLRDYQDWTGTRVAVVFDGKGRSVSVTSDPGEIQVFYSRAGQTADSIIERLASKYGDRYRLLVATSDVLEQETASACGAECISVEALRWLLEEATPE